MLRGPGFLGPRVSEEAVVSLPTSVPLNRQSPGSALPGPPAPVSGSTVMRPALRAAPRGVFLSRINASWCLMGPQEGRPDPICLS